jgi:hypothetical protein
LIDLALESGNKLNEIAEQFAVSKFSLSRHRAKHLALAATTAESDGDLAAQVAMWRIRADQLWLSATADADTRGQAQAVAAGLRSVELQARRERETTESATSAIDEQIDVRELDRYTSQLIAALGKIQLKDERVLQLAIAMITTQPDLLDQAERIMQEKTYVV